jgi:adenylate kinase
LRELVKSRIVLLGPPASGKGTQAELIQERFGIPATSTGAILREQKRAGTEIGHEADKYTSRGQLVPDPLIIDLVRAWLQHYDSRFTFDGFPRTIGQAEALTKLLDERETPLDIVIALEADYDILLDRVTHRRFCSACGNVVRVGFHVSDADAPCPRCGGRLERRTDDNPETLNARMREYREKTEPLLSYYARNGKLRAIAAAESPEEVFTKIVNVLQ